MALRVRRAVGRKLAAFGEADQLAFLARNDMPQGEFWFTVDPIKRRQDMNRPQAMVAHTYGKRLAAAEAFTHMCSTGRPIRQC